MSRMKPVSAIQTGGSSRRRLRRLNPVSRATLALFALLALGACSSLLNDGRAPVSTWWLEPADLTTAPALPAVVLELTVVPGLDSDRILTLDDDAQLNHFEGALWPERLPEWVHSLVARSLETSPAGGSQPPGACRLALELRRFWARLDTERKTRSVEVAMTGTLQCGNAEPAPVAAEARETVNDHRLAAIVAAFQSAFNDTQRQLAGQLAEQVEQQAGS